MMDGESLLFDSEIQIDGNDEVYVNCVIFILFSPFLKNIKVVVL
jgi:hypothetical protein